MYSHYYSNKPFYLPYNNNYSYYNNYPFHNNYRSYPIYYITPLNAYNPYHFRNTRVTEKKFIIYNKNLEEIRNDTCYEVVSGEVKCEPAPLSQVFDIPFLAQEQCYEQPPEMKPYPCKERRTVNIIGTLIVTVTDANLTQFNQNYSCFVNNSTLAEASKAFEQSIPSGGGEITNAILDRAIDYTRDAYINIINRNQCSPLITVRARWERKILSDWKN
ncbi:hypothetical protein [Bacillus sp. C1]